jgi:hypothetical protein
MKTFPALSMVPMFILQKHTNDKTFNGSRYASLASNVNSLQKKAYIGEPEKDTPFYNRLKSYYFGNVCEMD